MAEATAVFWLAGRIRRALERQFDTAYQPYVDLLGELRPQIQEQIADPVRRKALWSALLDSEILDLYRSGAPRAAEQRAQEILATLQRLRGDFDRFYFGVDDHPGLRELVSDDALERYLANVPMRRIAVMIDSCFSERGPTRRHQPQIEHRIDFRTERAKCSIGKENVHALRVE